MWSKANLMIYQGDDYGAIVTVADGVTPPAEIIAGYTAQAQIRSGPADTNPIVLVDIQTTVASPYVYLTIPSTDTAGLKTSAYWDLQLTDPTGQITTVLAGIASVTPEVTR